MRHLALSIVLLALAFLPLPAGAADTAPATRPAVDGVPSGGLILDLDADHGVEFKDGRVVNWVNRVESKARDFRATRDTGRPSLKKGLPALHGHDAVHFEKQELINAEEDAFDDLGTGGYTWCAVLAVQRQVGLEKDVNAFFGNLKNGGLYEGIWAGLDDDNTLWCGSRNGVTFGRWNDDNPKVSGPKLEMDRFYVLAGRMTDGKTTATIELFVDSPKPVASKPFPVNPKANASKMAIGQERDATNHPGRESFNGDMARLLIWNRPLADDELAAMLKGLRSRYTVSE